MCRLLLWQPSEVRFQGIKCSEHRMVQPENPAKAGSHFKVSEASLPSVWGGIRTCLTASPYPLDLWPS